MHCDKLRCWHACMSIGCKLSVCGLAVHIMVAWLSRSRRGVFSLWSWWCGKDVVVVEMRVCVWLPLYCAKRQVEF